MNDMDLIILCIMGIAWFVSMLMLYKIDKLCKKNKEIRKRVMTILKIVIFPSVLWINMISDYAPVCFMSFTNCLIVYFYYQQLYPEKFSQFAGDKGYGN